MYMNHVKVDIIWDRLIMKHDMYFVIVDSFIPFFVSWDQYANY